MEEHLLPREPLLQPSPQRKALISLGLGGGGAILLALAGLFLPVAHFSVSMVLGLTLGQLLLFLWRRASLLSDAACFAAGVVAGGGGSLLQVAGCLLLARVAPGVVGVGCSASYLEAGIWANALGVLFGAWTFGWGWLRWYSWGLARRERKARRYLDQFGGRHDAHR
jgi:hypothetical protein